MATLRMLLLWGLPLLAATPLGAQVAELQREIAESRLRLDEIRAERERLQAELEGARGGVRDASRELQNIERQLSASRSVLAELDLQLETLESASEENVRRLGVTRERNVEARTLLQSRLRDVYKLGPLHSARVLLGADSFADLLNRYRYLQMIAAYDRALIDRVGILEADLRARDRELQANLAELERLRRMQAIEVEALRSVEAERQFALTDFRSQEARTINRLETLGGDEQRLQSLVTDLDRRRIASEQRTSGGGAPPAPTSLTSADAGVLDWPVAGGLLYRFGPERRPDGTMVRWNGIGIAAPLGAPVQAVRDGTVVLAGPFEGYGTSVILSHGDGMYTLYLHLDEVGVVEGRRVTSGQVVGTVGGRGTPQGPHIEFQIRSPSTPGGSPQAQDPLLWLRPAPGGRR